MSSDTYRWLAKYYDHLFEFRRPFESARKRIVDPLLPRIESACDLGCGTGTFAVLLARRGIVTFAVDLSPDMCRLARERRGGRAVSVKVIEQTCETFGFTTLNLINCDLMRSIMFRPGGTFDECCGPLKKPCYPAGISSSM